MVEQSDVITANDLGVMTFEVLLKILGLQLAKFLENCTQGNSGYSYGTGKMGGLEVMQTVKVELIGVHWEKKVHEKLSWRLFLLYFCPV